MTVVYYRGPFAQITDEVMAVWSPDRRVYLIGELDAVYVLQGAQRRRWTPLRVIPAVAVTLAVLVPVLHLPNGILLALLVIAAGAVVSAALLREQAQPYELRALHRGADVRLFGCADAQTFGQVRRALQRAMERHAVR